MKKIAVALILALLLPLTGTAQPPPQKVYATGRVAPPNLKQLYERSFTLYGQKLKNLPKAAIDKYDCRTLGLVGPVQNQANCGSCWLFSGADGGTSAFYHAGLLKNDGTSATYISQQQGMDCFSSGGCNGDDNTTVLQWLMDKGMVTQADYGVAYHASRGRCQDISGKTVYKLKAWGFCTASNQQGVAAVQDIKNAMAAYGPIPAAIAADNAFANNPPGRVFVGHNHTINHDIVLCGWDDTKAWTLQTSYLDDPTTPAVCLGCLPLAFLGFRKRLKKMACVALLTVFCLSLGSYSIADEAGTGAWILRNSWDKTWCDAGYCYIAYGSNDVGTEAVFCVADGPGPVPPTPPTPTGIPVVASMTATTGINTPYTFQITATNSPTKYDSSSLPAGLSLVTTTGVISGTPTAAGTYTVALLATNAAGTGVGSLTLTVGTAPTPPTPGNITITLTQEQVQSILTQAGAIPIRKDMPVSQFIELLNKCKTTPAYNSPPPAAAPTPQVSMPQRLFDPFSFLYGVSHAGNF